MKSSKILVPTFSTQAKLDKNFRGIDPDKSYSNLDFKHEMNEKYYHPTITNPGLIRENSISYSDDFSKVTDEIMFLCKSVKGFCVIHKSYPGVQWNNDRENYEDNMENWKLSMKNKLNHYFHDLVNSEKIWGIDSYYCMCQEYGAESKAFKTLLLPILSEEWNSEDYHGDVIIPDNTPKEYHHAMRIVSPELKDKIIKDSIDLLASEYKIHLQPKPEYQLAVIKELIKLIKFDLQSYITTWKAIITYDRVIGNEKMPSIVIYPVNGKENAQIVLNKIIEHFSQFNSKEIGLDITPRYNAKYNELIYWANGSGDHKKYLNEKYFTNSSKNFYIGYELYPN